MKSVIWKRFTIKKHKKKLGTNLPPLKFYPGYKIVDQIMYFNSTQSLDISENKYPQGSHYILVKIST